jgi:arginyl-tRNA synthetase
VKSYLRSRLAEAITAAGAPADTPVGFEHPRSAEHGDLTTTVAMSLARSLKKNPRQIAQDIVSRLKLDPDLIRKTDIAGAGFINFTFTDRVFWNGLRDLVGNPDAFGRSDTGGNRKTQVEFVSANPTGPLTVGHGRGAVFGDTVAKLLEWTGHDVTREYYYNDAGRQMRILGDSVRHRYLQLLGDDITFPEDYYQGEYIREIAEHLVRDHKDTLRQEPAEGKFKEQAEHEIFADIRKTLESLGIEFKSFYNEHWLYRDGKIEEVIAGFRKLDLVYEQEGALWLKTSALGGEKDKVIVKSSGEPTYRLPDIAYHVEKFRRGFDLVVDVFGSDHIATYPDVLAGVKALGYDSGKVKVLIHQFVTIVQDGEAVKMSTRKANFVTLDELIAEAGADVVRYFFLMRSITSHLNFDLGLAKQQTDENPVYYLQYAHARISGILRYGREQGKAPALDARLDLLAAPEELELIKLLLQFPEMVESCATTFEPHRLAEYLHTVAGCFHKFYGIHRVVTDDEALTVARLTLCDGTRIVLRNGLRILGISSPERM